MNDNEKLPASEIAELRKLRDTGMVSAVGEYTPPEFWDALDEIDRLRAQVPEGAVGLIAAERQRQITAEGWTPEHDDWHFDGSLAVAAACYATQANQGLHEGGMKVRESVLRYWPWDWNWWKPTPDNRIRELVKAGALIVAEIERLQRAAAPTPQKGVDGE